MNRTIKELPKHSRPREKLRERGAAALTDEELIAAIIRMGTAKIDVRISFVSRKGYFSFQEAGINEIHPQLEILEVELERAFASLSALPIQGTHSH